MSAMSLLRGITRRWFGVGHPEVLLAKRYPHYAIGRGSYGSLDITDYGGDTTFRMGAFCSVAADVRAMVGGEHRWDWTTTYPFNVLDPTLAHITGHPSSRGDVVIGNDVWLGRESFILSGVTIGDGAVVAARALVVNDVPPYAIVGGSPAKVIRYRFSEDLIRRLLALKWWEWSDERIRRAAPYMLDTDIERFLDMAESGEI